jgi:DNA-binding transcriptional ArsR family regulator
MNTGDQGEVFKATATWFHVFVAMFDSGDVAKMGPHTFTVYAAIKAHTNFTTGRAFPEIATLMEKTGISRSEVLRALKRLEAAGYILKERRGRRNVYTLREKVEIQDEEGRPAAVATWDYLPSTVREAQAELRKLVMTGDFDGARIINIERLTLNVQHIQGDNNTATAVQVGEVRLTPEEVESLSTIADPRLRAKMQAIFQGRPRRGDVDNS